jgi:integrase/recombinase XerD
MAQAKTLTPAELDQVLDLISHRSFALRNRVMLLTGMWSGMRVSEIASLSVSDVMNANGTVKAEVRLTAEQTKPKDDSSAQCSCPQSCVMNCNSI